MEKTYLEIVQTLNILHDFSEKKLPQKISHAITQNIIILLDHYQVYQIQLKKIYSDYTEYMETDNEGNVKCDEHGIPNVAESVYDEFRNQVMELLNIKVNYTPYYINENLFDYDDNGIYSPLSPNDNIILHSILCRKDE